MKMLLLALGGALALLHLSLAVSATPFLGTQTVHIVSAVIGVAVAVLSFGFNSKSPSPVSPAPAPITPPAPAAPLTVAPTPVAVPATIITAPSRTEAPRAEAEVVAFLSLLQEKGRFVDFLREDLAGATDEQVGAAARVVHSGCRSVLAEYIEIVPVRSEPEGAKITLVAGYDTAAHRLLGSVAAQPPYTGTLLHPGWLVRTVKLPRVTGTTGARPWPVLAPAEIQVAAS